MQEDNKEQVEIGIRIIALNDLGAGNRGVFGPISHRELKGVEDCAKERYISPNSQDSHCMDDGCEGEGYQLPGNRAITEIAGEYMDQSIKPRPLSVALADKVDELVATGHIPWFHGDDSKGKAGCAALGLLCSGEALRYNYEHRELVAALVYDRLRLMGVDSLEHGDIMEAIETGALRAGDQGLLDVSPEEAFDIARQHGAGTEILERKHRVAGAREDISPNTFNGGRFRNEHVSDDGEPLGMLSINYGAYTEELKRDDFLEDEAAKKIMHACLFTVGVLKLASKEHLPVAIVG